jgi:hypothetical protein
MSSTKGYVRVNGVDSSGKPVYVYVKPGSDGKVELAKKVAAADRKATRDKTTVSGAASAAPLAS